MLRRDSTASPSRQPLSFRSTESQFVPRNHAMNKRRHRFSPADSFFQETLESRVVLSVSTVHPATAEVAGRAAHHESTTTTLAIHGGTLGQPTTFNVTVRAAAALGSPQGTVNLVDHGTGTTVATLSLTPTTSHNARSAYSTASYTLTPQPGGDAYFFGRHSITAQFVPNGSFTASSMTKNFTVAQPHYTTIANGVKIATIANGQGPAIQSGQNAKVLYTGYLAKTGSIFDESLRHGGTPLGFKVGAGQMIPGFDAGTVGMQVGETRIIEIPASQGYGSAANGPIPANSTLIFVVTLKSIG